MRGREKDYCDFVQLKGQNRAEDNHCRWILRVYYLAWVQVSHPSADIFLSERGCLRLTKSGLLVVILPGTYLFKIPFRKITSSYRRIHERDCLERFRNRGWNACWSC